MNNAVFAFKINTQMLQVEQGHKCIKKPQNNCGCLGLKLLMSAAAFHFVTVAGFFDDHPVPIVAVPGVIHVG